MLFYPISSYSKLDLRINIPTIIFLWIPILLSLQNESITSILLEIFGIIIFFIILVVFIGRVYKNNSRAIIYITLWLIPLIMTSILYLSGLSENVYFYFNYKLVGILILLTSMFLLSIKNYRDQKNKLSSLFEKGLLKKYYILDHENGIFNPYIYYPGVDGTSPEQMMKKDRTKLIFLYIFPFSGVTFFILRTVNNSVFWILLFLFIFIWIFSTIIAAKTYAVLLFIKDVERNFSKKINIQL